MSTSPVQPLRLSIKEPLRCHLVSRDPLIIVSYGAPLGTPMYSGIYNIGIGSGALVGGLATLHSGLASVGLVAGGIATIACLWSIYCLRRFF